MVAEMTLNEVLKGHSFLAGLPESQIARLSPLAREVSFQEGDVILSAGQQSKHFYMLLSGSVCVEVCARAYTICVQALGPGDAFGWSALLDHHDTLFQVRAREHSTTLRLDAEDLCTAFRQDAELAAEILRRALNLVAGRVQATEAKLAEFCGVRPSMPIWTPSSARPSSSGKGPREADFSFQFQAEGAPSGRTLEDVERVHIERVLRETDHNLARAARILSIHRSTLYNKVKRYGLKYRDLNSGTRTPRPSARPLGPHTAG